MKQESKHIIKDISDTLEAFEQNNSHDVVTILRQAKINPFEQVVEPPTFLSIGGVAYGTLGNFSCITGKPKSKKTFLITQLIAATVFNDEDSIFHSHITDKTVLHFDTEQSEFHTWRTTNRVINLTSESIENYNCYCLRPYDPSTRIKAIEHAINSTENLGLVIIDGIADLITSYNDEEQASLIINKFMKWTTENNIHIITVVHQNKGDYNAKGHLGSFILQKAETVLSVKRQDNNLSSVEATHSRGVEIEPFSFSIDDNGLPYTVEYKAKVKGDNKQLKNPRTYELETNRQLIVDTFNGREELRRMELLGAIQFQLEKLSITIGDNKCREWLTYFQEEKMITQEKNNAPYKLVKDS